MFEESMSIPAIWAAMNSWFTPAVFFVLLNVMIGTIAVTSGLTSGLGSQKPQQKTIDDHPQQPQLPRSPSVLQRLKSINLYPYIHRSQEPTTTTTTTTSSDVTAAAAVSTSIEEEEPTHEIEEGEEGERSIDEVYSQLQELHVSRSVSETKPESCEVPVKMARKMKKSASAKLVLAKFEDDGIVESQRPATVREGKAKATEAERDGDDEEVDAKADDFINKFKQQLKLQRVDSIIRYKEMLTRGSGK